MAAASVFSRFASCNSPNGIVLSITRYAGSRCLYALKIRGGRRKFESREEEKAVDALPGDNLFRTFDRSDRPVSRRISGNWVGPFDPFPPAASGTGLTSNRAHFGRLPAFECISMKVSIVATPPPMTYPRQKSSERPGGGPLLAPFSIISQQRLSRSRDERGLNNRRKWTSAFRFSNDIGYRRYNSRPANPSIIVSAAITLPRLTII